MGTIIKKVFKLLCIFIPAGILYAYAMFQGGFVSWFLFFSTLPIFIYMILLFFYPMSRIKLDRKIYPVISETGSTIKIELTFKRPRLLPLYYCIIEDVLPESIHFRDTKRKKYSYLANPDRLKEKRNAKKIIFPWFKRTFSFEYQIEEVPRGQHLFNQIRVISGDFIGFIKKEKIYEVQNSLMVYPMERNLKFHKYAQSFEEGESSSYNRMVKNTMVVSGVREYIPGDRVSWIDWKSTAKRNTMMTKEFDQEKSQDMYILFDGTKHDDYNWLAFEGSVEIGVSLIDAIREESAQLFFASLGRNRQVIPVHKDSMSKEQVKRYLATVQPEDSLPFGQMIKQEVGKLPKGYLSMVVTTELSLELYDTLIQLKQKNSRVVLFLVKASSLISAEERQRLKYLSSSGVVINLLTEGILMKEKIEVNA
ncbi:Uncharacterized conserved protein, DUF58 family, contains vWF domain [Salinibacillus kushneri]|uniref:Uncharacterized conserved protein, DUF58 family, contains vWF domain n=1 Tax=Salinibacillus kushneri TaxID=237682 RepID=A0A1I0J735_9BACI|nr:DUF58 domain-containing protein [Salinibacillus kushneri]SEU05576.1 Uncharacterized conserved protein, DUF58 family, contains vWF domain [Salinibacillus kushneri]